jgi:hypothetical protein
MVLMLPTDALNQEASSELYTMLMDPIAMQRWVYFLMSPPQIVMTTKNSSTM